MWSSGDGRRGLRGLRAVSAALFRNLGRGVVESVLRWWMVCKSWQEVLVYGPRWMFGVDSTEIC